MNRKDADIFISLSQPLGKQDGLYVVELLRTGTWEYDNAALPGGKFTVTPKDLDEFKKNFDSGIKGYIIPVDVEHAPVDPDNLPKHTGSPETFGYEGDKPLPQNVVGWLRKTFKGKSADNGKPALFGLMSIEEPTVKEAADNEQAKFVSCELNLNWRNAEDGKDYKVIEGVAITSKPYIKRMTPMRPLRKVSRPVLAVNLSEVKATGDVGIIINLSQESLKDEPTQIDPVSKQNRLMQWHADSHPVTKDDDGEPKLVYHGTTRNNNNREFDISKTDPESFWGQGHYFTSSVNDLNANYATDQGPDVLAKIDRDIDRKRYNDDSSDGEGEDIEDAVRDRYIHHHGAAIPAYLHMKNPFVVGEPHETFFDHNENYDEDTDEYSEPTGKAVELLDAIDRVAGNYKIDTDELREKLQEHLYENGGITASHLMKILRGDDNWNLPENYDDINHPDSLTRNHYRDLLQDLGYDGVVQNAAKDFKDMAGVDPDTRHYIVWNSNQIKSPFNKGIFDENDPRIDMGEAPVSETIKAPEEEEIVGTSSKMDMAELPESLSKPENENQPHVSSGPVDTVAYHGSPYAGSVLKHGFDFKNRLSTGSDQYGPGMYLTSNPDFAKGYAAHKSDSNGDEGIVKAEIHLRNPIHLDSGTDLGSNGFPPLTAHEANAMVNDAIARHGIDALQDWGDVAHEGHHKLKNRVIDTYTGTSPVVLINDLFKRPIDGLRSYSNASGYDGVHIDHDLRDGNHEDHYVVWFPEQISKMSRHDTPLGLSEPELVTEEADEPSPKQEKGSKIELGKDTDTSSAEASDSPMLYRGESGDNYDKFDASKISGNHLYGKAVYATTDPGIANNYIGGHMSWNDRIRRFRLPSDMEVMDFNSPDARSKRLIIDSIKDSIQNPDDNYVEGWRVKDNNPRNWIDIHRDIMSNALAAAQAKDGLIGDVSPRTFRDHVVTESSKRNPGMSGYVDSVIRKHLPSAARANGIDALKDDHAYAIYSIDHLNNNMHLTEGQELYLSNPDMVHFPSPSKAFSVSFDPKSKVKLAEDTGYYYNNTVELNGSERDPEVAERLVDAAIDLGCGKYNADEIGVQWQIDDNVTNVSLLAELAFLMVELGLSVDPEDAARKLLVESGFDSAKLSDGEIFPAREDFYHADTPNKLKFAEDHSWTSIDYSNRPVYSHLVTPIDPDGDRIPGSAYIRRRPEMETSSTEAFHPIIGSHSDKEKSQWINGVDEPSQYFEQGDSGLDSFGNGIVITPSFYANNGIRNIGRDPNPPLKHEVGRLKDAATRFIYNIGYRQGNKHIVRNDDMPKEDYGGSIYHKGSIFHKESEDHDESMFGLPKIHESKLVKGKVPNSYIANLLSEDRLKPILQSALGGHYHNLKSGAYSIENLLDAYDQGLLPERPISDEVGKQLESLDKQKKEVWSQIQSDIPSDQRKALSYKYQGLAEQYNNLQNSDLQPIPNLNMEPVPTMSSSDSGGEPSEIDKAYGRFSASLPRTLNVVATADIPQARKQSLLKGLFVSTLSVPPSYLSVSRSDILKKAGIAPSASEVEVNRDVPSEYHWNGASGCKMFDSPEVDENLVDESLPRLFSSVKIQPPPKGFNNKEDEWRILDLTGKAQKKLTLASRIKYVNKNAKEALVKSVAAIDSSLSHIFAGIDVEFTGYHDEVNNNLEERHAGGLFYPTMNRIVVGAEFPQVLYHEIFHALDLGLARDVLDKNYFKDKINSAGIEIPNGTYPYPVVKGLSESYDIFHDKSEFLNKSLPKDLIDWGKAFTEFTKDLVLDKAKYDQSAERSQYYTPGSRPFYTLHPSEVFARFGHSFVSWANIDANLPNRYPSVTGDSFGDSDYRKFIKLLQWRSMIDANHGYTKHVRSMDEG